MRQTARTIRMCSWRGKFDVGDEPPTPGYQGHVLDPQHLWPRTRVLPFSNAGLSYAVMAASSLRPRSLHRRQDVLVTGAAAQVGCKISERLFVDVRCLLKGRGGEHQESGRAKAALQRMMFDECALQGMQSPGCPSPSTVTMRCLPPGPRTSGTNECPSIYHHCACATHAMLAAEMCPGQAALFAQRIGQGIARFHHRRCRSPIHVQFDIDPRVHGRLCCSARNGTACTG